MPKCSIFIPKTDSRLEFFMKMKSAFELLPKSLDVPRCTHLTVHTVLCTFCGMTVCSDCNLKHKSIHSANKDQEIPKSEFED